MSSRQRTRGECVFCHRDLTCGGLIRHLKSCDERQGAVQAANTNNRQRRSQTLYHLQAKNAWSSDYWLHLEMNGAAILENLDAYLRTIWLECCGHMSQFTPGTQRWGTEISMSRKAEQVLGQETELTHIYDFGTPTETVIKVVDSREGKPLSKHPIYLMARNNMLEIECEECAKPAHWLQEDYENDYGDWLIPLCDDHANGGDNGALEIVNSPRRGVCGYTGPAEPPY